MYLLSGSSVAAEHLSCKRFNILLEKLWDRRGSDEMTLLMWVCAYNPALLNQKLRWLPQLIERQAGRRSASKAIALMWLFQSRRVGEVDFNGP